MAKFKMHCDRLQCVDVKVATLQTKCMCRRWECPFSNAGGGGKTCMGNRMGISLEAKGWGYACRTSDLMHAFRKEMVGHRTAR